MTRLTPIFAAAALAVTATFAAAQPVEIAPLAAPDAFSTPGRETGLPPDLWRGASVKTLRAVLPLLSTRPLSPAAATLARRVLATGAVGPKGADASLAGARASALLALGDVRAANAMLQRAGGLERNAELARAAAESALLNADDDRACAIADGLGAGRDGIYWLRLRAFCQARAGRKPQAQLTYDLAQAQARDATYGRLMEGLLSGAKPGAASLRNGLDYALTRQLGLDPGKASASPAVAAALSGIEPGPDDILVSAAAADVRPYAQLVADGGALPPGGLAALIEAAASADAKSRGRLQSTAILMAALEDDPDVDTLSRLASLPLGEGKAPIGRNYAITMAATRNQKGETAMLALWSLAESGSTGVNLNDRVRAAWALNVAGLEADARNLVLEGLVALK
jgi:hypothetical protein